MERAIVESSSEGNPSVTTQAADRKRDSKAAITTWKTRLTPDEQALIRERTFPVWKEFYGDDDW